MRWLRVLALTVAGLLAPATAFVAWIVFASLPRHEGTLRAAGLHAPAAIERDAHGVPAIVAASEADALFALGYVHAQDRLWQMEFNRRLAQGRLAEILGPQALETDRFLRTIGVYRRAQAMADELDPEIRAFAEAYAAGVNAFLAQRRGPLPPEFWLTRAPAPQPWTVADSAAWVLMMGWDLSSASMRFELGRLQLAAQLTTAEIDELRPRVASGLPPGVADFAQMYRLMGLWSGAGKPSAASAELARLAQALPVGPFGDGDGLGSNNWVVSGQHTRSGAPLLANDPHLSLTMPSVWYYAQLRAPGLEVFGATLPGVPYVMLGRNRNVAWGFTNTTPDVQDLYLERINPADPGEYATPTGYAKFDTREEVIAVRGAEPVRLAVRSTRHGPVISGVFAAADKALAQTTQYVLALQWTALIPGDRSLVAARAMNRAADAQQFLAATRDWHLAQQNVVYADRHGQIGFVAPGRIPRRKPDNDLFGVAPAPGWDARYDWDGWLPFEELPLVLDPPSGTLASANQKIVGPEYRPFLTADWHADYRYRRIRELLAATDAHDAASFRRIQADVVSLAARDVLAALRGLQPALAPRSAAASIALERLAAWDGSMRADAPEPAIYYAWLRALRARIFTDDLGQLAPDFIPVTDLHAATLAVLRGQTRTRDWCDDQRTANRRETCAELAEETLEQTVVELAAASGTDILALRWGDVHRATLEHRPLSAVPLLGDLFNRTLPVPGDTYTVNVAALRLRGEAPFGTSFMASMRAIYDLSADGTALWIYGGGQVGHPAARAYDNLLARWQQVEYLPLAWEPQPVTTLSLVPAP